MSYYQDPNVLSAALRKRKTLKKSINFSIMVIGESGLGRSTFINSLCGGNSIVPTSSTVDQDPFTKKLTLRHENVELEDNEGHKISLNIIDTPNFANSINCDEDFKVVVDFIRHQYDEVLLEESRVKRNPRFKDGRIHVLIYMINPTNHGLLEIDVKFMLHVNKLVNLIPIIAKSDSLTPDELKNNKKLILEDLKNYGISYYKFNEYEYEQDYIDDEIIEYNKYLNSLLPFSIIGANEFKPSSTEEDELLKLRVLNPINSKPINIEMPEYNDFTILKNVLLITHLNEFKEITHDIIYENYRTEALSGKQFQYINGERVSNKDLTANGHNAHGSLTSNGYGGHDADGRTNSLSTDKSGKSDHQQSQVNEDYLSKEEQIKLEEERLKKFEERVHQDLINKRKELLERENELKEIEKRLLAEGLKLNEHGEVVKVDE